LARKSFRIPRELNDLIQALDDHMVILRASLLRSREEASFIKVIASELRVLVCSVSGTEGLLWRLCDEMQISDAVLVMDPGEIDPDHPLARGIELSFSTIRRPSGNEHGEYISLEEIIKTFEAIFVSSITNQRITHEILIRLISDQIGGAHEDPGIAPELKKLRSLVINGKYAFEHLLLIDAELVLEVAERVIRHAEMKRNYKRRASTKDSGNLTIVMTTKRRQHLLGTLDLFTIGCELNQLFFVFTGTPAGLKIQVVQYSAQVKEVAIPVGKPFSVVSVAICYSSHLKQIRVLDGNKEILRHTCNLGWIESGFFSEPQFALKTDDFISIDSLLLYDRLLSPAEVDLFKGITMSDIQKGLQKSKQRLDFPD
jgi:hypothetical protein